MRECGEVMSGLAGEHGADTRDAVVSCPELLSTAAVRARRLYALDSTASDTSSYISRSKSALKVRLIFFLPQYCILKSILDVGLTIDFGQC